MEVPMIKVEVDAGVCGMMTTIKAESADMQTATLEISSDCPDIRQAAEELKEIDGMQEAFGKVGDTSAYTILRKYCKHAACPVPAAIVKAAEAACSLALPKDVTIKIEKIES
jgi:hypothetical protein